MNRYIRHIVEDFNFNNIRNDSKSSDVVLNLAYQEIFKKLNTHGIRDFTPGELRMFVENKKNGYKFKYVVKDLDELKILVKLHCCEDLNWLDVSNIDDMHELFKDLYFVGDVSKWDVHNVKNMSKMFFNSDGFKSDISNWDTSNVENMCGMFMNTQFSPNLSRWDTSRVQDMSHMFQGSQFNGDISKWNVSNVETMSSMFDDSVFTGDISDWDVHNVENMWGMFLNSKFNGLLFNWNTVSVKNMGYMFAHCSFNQPLFGWDVSGVESISYMFYNNPKFNQDLSMWNLDPIYATGVFSLCPIKEEYKPIKLRKAYFEESKNKMDLDYSFNESVNFAAVQSSENDYV